MNENILEMRNIDKVFAGVQALKNVSFTLGHGEAHALIGENGAGKSTLMKILIGLYSPDGGEILLDGKSVRFHSPADALNMGISMIHQEICLVPNLSVAENIWLGRENIFKEGTLLNSKKRFEKTKELLDKLEINVDPNELVINLSTAYMQLIELARAVSYDAKIIIMDEPTSALSDKEIKLMYKTVKGLIESGTSVIFITHKLEEILAVCSDYTVLRDGSLVGSGKCADVTQADLIKMIAGRDLSEMYQKKVGKKGNVVLQVKNFCSEGIFKNINFEVHSGEVLGFAGLMGAGRSEIMRAIFGIDEKTSGEIILDGKTIEINHPKDAIRFGIGMITEDRMVTGSIYSMSVIENATIASLDCFSNSIGVINGGNEKKAFYENAGALTVKYNSPDELIGNLSGGNQQKVIISRWLLRNVKVLIMDEPTRGIDVGAKFEIYKLIEDLAESGMAVILVSSEMREILGLSDRIMVVRNGEITYEVDRANANQETLISHSFGIA